MRSPAGFFCLILGTSCATSAPPRTDGAEDSESGTSTASADVSAGATQSGDEAPPPEGTSSEASSSDTAASEETGAGEVCAALALTPEQQELPVDIIVATDNSGSMAGEIAGVQANLGVFAQSIVGSGIDARVVLISEYPAGIGHGICIDPPLGSGGCPATDNFPPLFTHIDQTVSHSLAPLVSTYPLWADVLRDDAAVHVLWVSDDHPIAAEGPLPPEFHTMFTALDPRLAEYRFHSVVAHSMCPGVDGIGTEYIALSNLTGGIAADLCIQDFDSVFDELEMAVVEALPLPCEIDIPMPAEGEEIDYDTASVIFGEDGLTLDVPQVSSAADCADEDGWYYDDPVSPTQIIACPATCARLMATETGTLQIEFACVDVPPEG